MNIYYRLLVVLSLLIIYFCGLIQSQTLPLSSSLVDGGDHSNISNILDDLLREYDTKIPPGVFDKNPTIIEADFNIRSMGPISEEDMTYSFDAYFRQTWRDKRLGFKGNFKELAVHIKLLELIWKPDTFFYNARGSYVHMITTPNKLLRIKPDGTILYSMRITIKASCPMFLHYFPVDAQMCPLQFGSYAFTSRDVRYIWKKGPKNSISIAKGLQLSQFDLVGYPAGNLTVLNRSGEFSTLTVSFILQRHMGYFLIQLYVPCTLIVSLSWVSFWINREATADRVGLGVTTVLTLATLSMDSRGSLPKVPYPTALDWFVILCFTFVIGSLIEFAGVHYFTKTGYGEVFDPSFQVEADTEDEYDHYQENGSCDHSEKFIPKYWNKNYSNNHTSNAGNHSTIRGSGGGEVTASMQYYRSKFANAQRHRDSCCSKLLKCLKSDARYKKMMARTGNSTGVNSVSMIDRVARYLFPLSFITINSCYWIAYSWNYIVPTGT